MREILFRGFHPCDGPDTIVVGGEKIKGRWVEGLCFLQDHDGNAAIGDKIDTKSVYQYHKEWILITGYGSIGLPVIADTVGQSTGLTDRTGKMIFEWDKLFSSHRNETYQVEWDKKLCRFRLACGNYHDDMVMADCYEVIGTVFDEEGQ